MIPPNVFISVSILLMFYLYFDENQKTQNGLEILLYRYLCIILNSFFRHLILITTHKDVTSISTDVMDNKLPLFI